MTHLYKQLYSIFAFQLKSISQANVLKQRIPVLYLQTAGMGLASRLSGGELEEAAPGLPAGEPSITQGLP